VPFAKVLRRPFIAHRDRAERRARVADSAKPGTKMLLASQGLEGFNIHLASLSSSDGFLPPIVSLDEAYKAALEQDINNKDRGDLPRSLE
jgi:hypothetical protein